MFSLFFIRRPVFAAVISIVIVLVGLVAMVALPIARYPDIAPPTVKISAVYPGADARTIAATVAAPIEQEVNGVEGMIYMSSVSANDGTYLRPGVETCLRVGLDGKIDLKALEEDTVIVLCDGETAEGRGWVWSWWREVAEESCVRFHCVQLGGGGNGALEALAEVSGGEFVRVP